MHTWAPRHVWRAPHGRNGMGPSADYLLPALAQGCLKDLCTEPVWEAMGTLSWLDGTLDMQLTQTHDVYAWHKGTLPYAREWNSHGSNAMAQCCESVAWWETEATSKIGSAWRGQGNSEPWLTERVNACPRPWAPWHGTGLSINVGKSRLCTRHTWSADESMLLVQTTLVRDTLMSTRSQEAIYREEC